jgi:hypothetical protein
MARSPILTSFSRRRVSNRGRPRRSTRRFRVLRQAERPIAEVQSAFTIGIALVQAPAALVSALPAGAPGLSAR